jgi:uncharacterized membrane protein
MPIGFGIMGLLWLVVPVLVVVLVVWAVRQQPPHIQPPPPGPPLPPSRPPESPMDILARRFASGEITAEEYQKARDLLQGGNPPAR